jgi:hypothetical protein
LSTALGNIEVDTKKLSFRVSKSIVTPHSKRVASNLDMETGVDLQVQPDAETGSTKSGELPIYPATSIKKGKKQIVKSLH